MSKIKYNPEDITILVDGDDPMNDNSTWTPLPNTGLEAYRAFRDIMNFKIDYKHYGKKIKKELSRIYKTSDTFEVRIKHVLRIKNNLENTKRQILEQHGEQIKETDEDPFYKPTGAVYELDMLIETCTTEIKRYSLPDEKLTRDKKHINRKQILSSEIPYTKLSCSEIKLDELYTFLHRLAGVHNKYIKLPDDHINIELFFGKARLEEAQKTLRKNKKINLLMDDYHIIYAFFQILENKFDVRIGVNNPDTNLQQKLLNNIFEKSGHRFNAETIGRYKRAIFRDRNIETIEKIQAAYINFEEYFGDPSYERYNPEEFDL